MFLLKLLLIFILALIVLFILVPVKYSIKGTYYQKMTGDFIISLIFGVISLNGYFDSGDVSLTLKILSIKKNIDIKKSNKKEFDKDDFLKKIKDNKIKTYINRNSIADLIKIVKKIWNNIKPSKIFIKGKIGFEDPMWTGIFFSLLNQIIYLPKGFEVKLDPVFNEQYFQGKGKMEGKICILGIMMILIKHFIIKPIKNFSIKPRRVKNE